MMQKVFFLIQLVVLSLLFLVFAGCEQEEDLSLLSSADLNVEALGMTTNGSGFVGRIAISADGNEHDRDDIGATPMGLAIIAHFGLQNKVVHYDYNSHIWGNGPGGQKQDMTESTLVGASKFNFNKGVFVSAVDETNKAEKGIANAINESSSSNPLYILVAGPMAVVGEGIKRSNADKRKHVTVISHSDWNNDYQRNGSYTAKDVKKTGVNFIQIKDQNGGLRRDWSDWKWLQKHSDGKLRWVYDRMQEGVSRKGDVSDAGMIWYLLKNDQNGNPNKLKSFFDKKASSPDNGDDDKDSGSGSGSGNCQASGETLYKAKKKLEKECGITYDKDKGHDCDPDGKGGWICSTGDAKSGSSGGGDDSSSGGSGSSGGGSDSNCEATGKTLGQAKNNFEKACGITYNKSKGHDCDPDGKGGWICSTGKASGGSSGGSNQPSTSSPSGGGSNGGNCQASGNTIGQAINNLEKACGISYDKSKGHDCDPDGKGGWICSTNDL